MVTLTIPRPGADEAATLKGEASGKPISTRALAYIMVGHVTHHVGVLRERYGLGAGSGAATG